PPSLTDPSPLHRNSTSPVAPVMQKNLEPLGVTVAHFAEGGANGSADLLPADPGKQKQRHQQVRDGFARRNQSIADRFRAGLRDWYGEERAAKVEFAEAFEICEYGRRPDKAELAKLFPFFGE